ncbi:MAG: diaminopimelate decarboxylase [Actinomycetota bacterium]
MQTKDPAARTRPWWSRPGLEPTDGRLQIAGRDAEQLARDHGTPLFAYDLERIREQVEALRSSYLRAGIARSLVRLALKAQREPEALALLRGLGPPGSDESVGIDACSPGEVLYALEQGWRSEEISYTGTNVSERDLDVILAHPVHVNVDLVSQIERVGRRAPGRTIGLRVNPRAGAGYTTGEQTLYARSDRPTKFGIYPEQLEQALEAARRHDLEIDTVHFHVGDGFLTDQIPRFEAAVQRVAEMTGWLREQGCPIEEVNTGGGLGVPITESDEPLDLAAYAEMLARHLGPLDVVVAVEPGDFLTKESAVLLAEVVTVEDRDGVTFVGVDAGWNLVNDRFIYHGRQAIVVTSAAEAPPTQRVTIAGHINEGDDLFGEDEPLPAVHEGDVIAVLNCGSYAQSMSIVHCLRPPAKAVFFGARQASV